MQGFVGWMGTVFSWLRIGITITLAVWILAVLPMLLFRRARPIAASILMHSSIYTGFTCWWYSFIISYKVLGVVGLAGGLLLCGVGVVPLAIFGAARHGIWTVFWNLILAVALVFGPRILAVFVMYRHAKREETREAQAQAAQPYLSFADD
ncbi:membrane hypothetical protein [Candidatus Sulfopaludibacter sp. SbA4]|nr:membrane hypothetical protein [Candidatus Sulfopaludibacter sp. SbA4]